MKHDFSKLPEIFNRYSNGKESLIAILQDIQHEYQYLPCEALEQTAKALEIPLSKVYSVSTFYNAFSLNPKGENIVKVCAGTACHVRGAKMIQDQIESQLKIKAGETSKDMKFSLELVACVGACAMAPVVVVNDQYHGSVKVNQIKKLLRVK